MIQLRFFWILLSTLGSACGDFLSKFLFDKYPNLSVAGSMTYGWLFEIVCLGVYILMVWEDFVIWNQSIFFIQLLVGLLIVRFIANKLYYEGVKRLDVSFVAILFTSSTLISVLGWILFHAESVTLIKFLGIWLIMWSIIAINYIDIHRQSSARKYILFVLASACIYGIVANVEKVVGLDFDPFVFRFWYSLFSVLLFLILYPKDLKEDLKYAKEGIFWGINILTSIAFSLRNIATLLAFKYGAEAWKVDAINNSAIFIIILLEILILKNREHIWLKIGLSAVTFIAMLLLKQQ